MMLKKKKVKNVIFLSMRRCGISWICEILKKLYFIYHGKALEIVYEADRALISHQLVRGYHSVHDIDPNVLLNVGYDRVIAIKRELETMKHAHAQYHGYLEQYENYEQMKELRPGFFERIEMQYRLLYQQEIKNERFKILDLADFNNHCHASFNELIEFLGFKFTFTRKIKLFMNILRNKVTPLIIPVKPTERNWEIYSSLLKKDFPLCNRLTFMKKIEEEMKKQVNYQEVLL